MSWLTVVKEWSAWPGNHIGWRKDQAKIHFDITTCSGFPGGDEDK